jgi:hypothetical protein
VGQVKRAVALAAVVATLAVASGGAASAQEAAAITLEASATRVAPGEEVTLTGALTPAAAGHSIRILDGTDAVVATDITDATGAFAATITPEITVTLRAVWQTTQSEPVTIHVGPEGISVEMSPIRLFDVVRVRGWVTPATAGGSVEVELLRSGRRVQTATATLEADGSFRARFRIMAPGRYRARATVPDGTSASASAVTGSDATPLPVLRTGSRSVFVRLLERRLAELGYRLAGVNRRYDYRTADAVVAFRKVQGLPRTFTVDAGAWRALADPRVPRPRVDTPGMHIEVDQTRQVLYTVVRGKVTSVIHVSTGAGGATRDGSFEVYRKLAGYSPNRLYYPSYFDGLRAIHGWTEVPTYPASHGCVRVPYWHAQWIFGLVNVGMRIVIYH